MFSLSFSPEFFQDVYESAERMPIEDRIALAEHLGRDTEFWPHTEMFAWEIRDMVKESDTCEALSYPVEVWITSDGYFTLTVERFDDEDE